MNSKKANITFTDGTGKWVYHHSYSVGTDGLHIYFYVTVEGSVHDKLSNIVPLRNVKHIDFD